MHTRFLANRLSRWLVMALVAVLSTSAAWAQSTANYTFATNSTGSLVDMSAGTTDALATGTYRDDAASTVQPLGFTFVFMGTPYTQFSVNSNGQLQLGATVISGTAASPASGVALLAPFGGDNAIQATGKVHYKVVAGTNRTLVVEWNSLRIPYSTTVGTGSVVQAILEENTGKVEYRYGAVYNNGSTQTRSIFISAGTAAGQIGVVKTFNATPTYDATVTTATTTALADLAAVAVLNSTADGARTVFTFTPAATVPAAPSVSFTATTQTSLTVNVTDNSTSEVTFTIYRSTDNVTFTPISTVASTTTSATGGVVTLAQTGLAPTTTYYYRATANTEGTQSAAGSASATTLAPVPFCGTKTVGPTAGADFPTLTAAFTAIGNNGLCGALVLELQAAYVSTTETFPLVYNYAGTTTNTVTVRPAAGATNLSITSTVAGAAFNIVGGKYLILDGRPGGSGSTVSGAALATDLTIASTSTTGIPLQFTSDAVFNTVQHTQIVGVGNNVSSYPNVNFTGTTTTLGNSDNTLQYNTIKDGATTPVTLVYSGSSLNSRNSIIGNNLSNFYLTAGSAYGMNINSAGTGWVISGNSIYQTASRVSTAGTMYGIYVVGGGGYTITNNFIGGSAPSAGGTPLTATGTAAAFRFSGVFLTLSGTVSSIQGNTVANINWVSSSGAATTYGIVSGIYISAGDANIGTTTGNVIGTVAGPISVSTTTTGGYSFGISSASSGTVSITGNTISNISGVGSATVASNVAGVLVSAGTLNTISRNKFYTLVAGSGVAATSTGIWLLGGTTNNVNNNLIGDLQAPASTSLTAVTGVLVAGGTTNNLAFNTIRLDGTSTGATFGTQGIYLNSLTVGLNLFDNLVVNLSVPVGTGGVAAAIRRISGTAGTVPANLFGNNNLYYAGTPSATNLIYVEGTTTATNASQTLAAYKAFLLNREANSVTETATPFASTTGSAATFLHLTAGAATQAESAGQTFGGVTTDFDGDTRNVNTPDIGADEGSFLLTDQTGPVISITALAGSLASTTSRTVTATITDASGVATGTSAPRLYFRKGTTGAFVASAVPTVVGSAYTFTFDYSLLSGVVAGDVINYYIGAQDALGNVSTNPTGGTGVTPPGSTAPSVAYTFTILPTLSGTYYVSATAATSPAPTRTYATLTAAVAAYNGSGLGGAVTFLLLDPTYSTGETFPIAILNNADASATNTLTIKPSNATGTTAFAITGSATTAILQLLASDYVTIDGSLGGTISATDPRPSRDLTIANTSTTATSYVVQQFAQFTNDGATFNTIKNLVAAGSSTATVTGTLYGIALQGVSNATTAGQYTNNTVQNCAVRGTQVGILSAGGAIALKTQNTLITQNDLNAAVGSGALTRHGIISLFDNNAQITLNNVGNIVNTAGTFDVSGINLGFSTNAFSNTSFTGSEVTNSLVSRNNIGVISNTNTYAGVGIGVATATTGTNTIANNFVSGVIANGTGADFGAGIYVNGSTGGGITRVLYNSVSMTGTATASSTPSFALAIGGTTPTVEVRNNVLYNSQSTGSTSFAIGYAYAGTTGNYAGLTSSNNAFAGTSGIALTGGLTGTVRATLADLNAETGQDRPTTATAPAGTSLALAASPFVSVTDLHTAALALNAAGTPITGITTDIDGDTRSTGFPDIGADEFTANLDASVAALTAPVANSTCFGATETVTASITNASTAVLNFVTNPVTVTVTITPATGTPQVFTTIVNTGTLAAGASQAVAFTGTANLSVLGTYTATVTTSLVGDDNPANNALTPVTITSATRAATFTYPAATICAGATGTIAPTLATGASAGAFTSTTGLTINATTGVITPSTSTAGTYVVTNTLPATATCPALAVTQTVIINPTPARPVLTAAYNGTTTTLTSSATTGNQFYLNGVAITGATGTTYVVNGTVAQLGSYTVVATNSFGCSSTASLPLVVTTARNSIAGASLNVYPNPTPNGQVTLELTGFRVATKLTVLDAMGRVVASEVLPATSGVAVHALDLSKVAAGVYTLRLANTDGVETCRLVRQ